ncbi:MAG: hypothetical protein EP330_11255 [Deltaproteobacteria bacterium]|nr:MAG: hypothetical protein EP330_11255 [Deltaproteobacteria bacterium]
MTIQHHIALGPEHLAGNHGLGRVVFLPGSRGRAEAIAAHFDDVVHEGNARALDSWRGTLTRDGKTIDVLSISSGMGTPSTEIVVHELIEAGARRIVRVGSCGAMDPHISASQVAILTGAVRDEQATRHIAPVEFPAVAHPQAVQAMVAGAKAAGLAEQTFLGIGHTKASLYAREFHNGPLGEENARYTRVLSACGAIASDMEAAMLFIQASVRSARQARPISDAFAGIQTAVVLGVYGGDDSEMHLDPELCRLADQRAIEVAMAGAMAWV